MAVLPAVASHPSIALWLADVVNEYVSKNGMETSRAPGAVAQAYAATESWTGLRQSLSLQTSMQTDPLLLSARLAAFCNARADAFKHTPKGTSRNLGGIFNTFMVETAIEARALLFVGRLWKSVLREVRK